MNEINVATITGLLDNDGSALEMLRGGQILLWTGAHQEIGPKASYHDRYYAPVPLPPSLERQLSLPGGSEPSGTLEELMEIIADVLEASSGLCVPRPELLPLTAFILATWLVDCLPSAPVLAVKAAAADHAQLAQVISAVCRRSVNVVKRSPLKLSGLPPGLCPTLILRQPANKEFERLLPVVDEPELSVAQDGSCISSRSAVLVISDQPLPFEGVTMKPPASSRYRRLSPNDIEQISSRLQPKLLRFRLEHHRHAASSSFDAPDFCSPVRILARSLGSALEGSANLQKDLLNALRTFDEETKVRNSETSEAVILESLLVFCHREVATAMVHEIADTANARLEDSGENRKLTAKAVGAVLRSLGLTPHRRNAGYEFLFTRDAKKRIHELAALFSVRMLAEPIVGCQDCGRPKSSGAPGWVPLP